MKRVIYTLALLTLSAPAQADWALTRKADDTQTVARYVESLRQNPEDRALERKLVTLYRERGRQKAIERALGQDAVGLLILGNVRKEAGLIPDAKAAYAAGLAIAPENPSLLIALGDLEMVTHDDASASAHLIDALAHVAKEKSAAVLARLVENQQNLGNETSVAIYYEQWLTSSGGSPAVRQKFARWLEEHGQSERAAMQFEQLTRDEKAPDRRRQWQIAAARLWLEAKQPDNATALLDAAAKNIKPDDPSWRELLEAQLDVARVGDRVRALVTQWEAAWPEARRTYLQWELLGRLHDELGDADLAEAFIKRALKANPGDLALRKRLIALYDRVGRFDDALNAYRELTRIAPAETTFELALIERLARSPDTLAEAISRARKLSGKSTSTEVLTAIGELYLRQGMIADALREKEKLVRLVPKELTPQLELADLYFQMGKRDQALALWQKLESRSDALLLLAQAYSDHDLDERALAIVDRLARAEPQNLLVLRGRALVLEHAKRLKDAERGWLDRFSVALVEHDEAAIVESREHLLDLLERTHTLAERLPALQQLTQKSPPTERVAFAILVARAEARLGEAARGRTFLAEQTLPSASPNARAASLLEQSELALAMRQQHDALTLVERAHAENPKLLPDGEFLPRALRLAILAHDDGKIATYAAAAATLPHADASTFVELGQLAEQRGNDNDAVIAYERALHLAPHDTKTELHLALLLQKSGQLERSSLLLRRALHSATDDDTRLHIAQLAIELDSYLGTLPALERELTPLLATSLTNPLTQSAVLDLYERLTLPLWSAAQVGDAPAMETLAHLGDRASAPLLSVLVDGDDADRRRALYLLGKIPSANLVAPLFSFAGKTSVLSTDLQEAAANVIAGTASETDVPTLIEMTKSAESKLRLAALYALVRIGSDKAKPIFTRLLDDELPALAALGCLGIGYEFRDHPLPATLAHRLAEAESATGGACTLGIELTKSEAFASHFPSWARDAAGTSDLQPKRFIEQLTSRHALGNPAR